MSANVIDLVSSSPTRPPTATTKPRPSSPSKNNPAPFLSSDWDSDVLDLSVEKPKECLTNSKPAASLAAVPRNDDFLFLSDDFDTTGDIDVAVQDSNKRRRISPPGSKPHKQQRNLKRTNSEAPATSSREPLRSAGLQRWNSVADPIQQSSSQPDPFVSSPGKIAGAKSPLPVPQMVDLSSDPFASPVVIRPSRQQPQPPGGQSKAPEGSTLCDPGKLKPRAADLIDLSSDPFDLSAAKTAANTRQTRRSAWDPISSSMPEVAPKSKTRSSARDNHDNVIDLDDYESGGSESDDLPDLANVDFSRKDTYKSSASLPRKNEPKAKSTRPTATGTSRKSDREKEQEKALKAKTREDEKKRKLLEKEQARKNKAVEKEKEKALAEVNKLRTDKKVSTPEMIVDLPSTLRPGLKVQIEEMLRDLDVKSHILPQVRDDEVVVRWRRKVSSRYDDSLSRWEPILPYIDHEHHVMIILEAASFVKLVQGDEGHDLEAYVLRMKAASPDCTFIYLIEGLDAWMRKNRNVRNRQFVSAVRNAGIEIDNNDDNDAAESQAPPPSSQAPARRGGGGRKQRQPAPEYIDEDSIEDALLSLQVEHDALIHHTAIPVETARWVAVFTQHISTVPYRRARDDALGHVGFCMDAGQVRNGSGGGGEDPSTSKADALARMLQELVRVTPPIAHGIAAAYPGGVAALVRGLEAGGPTTLQDCRKAAGRGDMGLTDRPVGPAVSRRIWKVFTGRDPDSTEV